MPKQTATATLAEERHEKLVQHLWAEYNSRMTDLRLTQRRIEALEQEAFEIRNELTKFPNMEDMYRMSREELAGYAEDHLCKFVEIPDELFVGEDE
jgi:uncharacterized coiled-coil DUF342 family protein